MKILFKKSIGFAAVFFGFLITFFSSLFFFLEDYSYSLHGTPIWPIFLGMTVMLFGILALKPKV